MVGYEGKVNAVAHTASHQSRALVCHHHLKHRDDFGNSFFWSDEIKPKQFGHMDVLLFGKGRERPSTLKSWFPQLNCVCGGV